MAAQVQIVEVEASEELDAAISSYVVQGFVLANKTAASATMVKKKEFNVIWAVIGFFVCVLPLLVYLIVYAAESDKVVEIRIRGKQDDESLAELERFADLRERGVITAEEYESEKRRILGPPSGETEG
jgi:hypothetical protein